MMMRALFVQEEVIRHEENGLLMALARQAEMVAILAAGTKP